MRKSSALLVLVCIFLPIIFIAMTLISLRPWLLERSFYQQIVSDERIYDALLTEEFPNQFNLQVLTSADQLPLSALNAALPEVITPDYLRTQATNLVDDAFDFIDGQVDSFEASLDFAPIKAALAGDAGARFAEALAGALPTCDVDQTQVAAGGRLARCIPAGGSVEEAEAQITAALPAVLETVPDQIILNNVVVFGGGWDGIVWGAGVGVRNALDIGIVTMIVIAIAAAIIGSWFGGNDGRSRLMWLSGALFLPAAFFVVAGLSLTTPLVISLLRIELGFDLWADTQLSESFRQAIVEIVVPLVQQMGSGFLVVGLVGGVVAGGLFVWSLTLRASQGQSYKVVQVPAQI